MLNPTPSPQDFEDIILDAVRTLLFLLGVFVVEAAIPALFPAGTPFHVVAVLFILEFTLVIMVILGCAQAIVDDFAELVSKIRNIRKSGDGDGGGDRDGILKERMARGKETAKSEPGSDAPENEEPDEKLKSRLEEAADQREVESSDIDQGGRSDAGSF